MARTREPRWLRRSGASLLAALALGGCAGAGAEPDADEPRRGALRFESLDADGDGALERGEFEALSAVLFERLDADESGALSREEYRALRERLRGARPRRGGRRGPRRP